jgi:hypothetical protein
VTTEETNLYSLVFRYICHYHMYIPHKSPDNGLSGRKHVVSGNNENICITVTPSIFISFLCNCSILWEDTSILT